MISVLTENPDTYQGQLYRKDTLNIYHVYIPQKISDPSSTVATSAQMVAAAAASLVPNTSLPVNEQSQQGSSKQIAAATEGGVHDGNTETPANGQVAKYNGKRKQVSEVIEGGNAVVINANKELHTAFIATTK